MYKDDQFMNKFPGLEFFKNIYEFYLIIKN